MITLIIEFCLGFLDNFWISFTKLGNPHFYWFGYDKPPTFTNWQNDSSPNSRFGPPCATISGLNAKWIPTPCDELAYFICEPNASQ